ncbi:CPBP family intramembrane metalloprotease [Nostoc spongiaeforme FACHB-130]|uniref:CPBP family intramembrane metalloprotease n=1 Tax=Nostoc spongiaeforme FACHB-130 TaxID=1357510 RepID=A0ABR8FXG8_9NOSO|nr:CPBP family intramembrane glutamic endopeptidase [Nostoc spongiaeforme]MBD2596016.1 CPBP family intramembrane metalloprotease [Nostoc spongiaeforme FACHB-130]
MAELGSEKAKFILIVLLIYILPVILILVGIIPFNFRFILLIIIAISVILYAKNTGILLEELGFKHNNTIPAIKSVLPVTFGLTGLIIIHYFIKGIRIDNSAIQWYFYLFFVIVSAPLQEFLYRGYLFYLFSKVGFSQYFLVTSSILYSFVHAIYWDLPTLLFTLVIGFIWGYHYTRFINLYSVIVSHILLGVVAIATGLL